MSLFDIEKDIIKYRDNINDKDNINNEEFQKLMLCISNIINVSYDIQLKYAKIGDMKNEIIKYDEKNQIEEILSDDDNIKKKKENNEEDEEEKSKVKSKQIKRNTKKVKEEIDNDEDKEEEKPKKKVSVRKTQPKKASIRKAPIKKNKKIEEIEEEDNSSDSE